MYSVAGYPISWLNNIRVCVCACTSCHIFIHSSVGTQVVSIPCLSLTMQGTLECRHFFETVISFSLHTYPEVGLLGQMVVLFHCFFFITSQSSLKIVYLETVLLQSLGYWFCSGLLLNRKLFYWLFYIFMYNMRMKVFYSKSID